MVELVELSSKNFDYALKILLYNHFLPCINFKSTKTIFTDQNTYAVQSALMFGVNGAHSNNFLVESLDKWLNSLTVWFGYK